MTKLVRKITFLKHGGNRWWDVKSQLNNQQSTGGESELVRASRLQDARNKQVADGLVERSTLHTRAQVKEAKRRINRRQQATSKENRRTKGPTDVTGIQDELFKEGYFGDGVSYDLAVDGVWGKMTLDAWNRRELSKEQKKHDNSITTKVLRAITAPVVNTLNNMFPFGYDNSKVSSEVTNNINSALNTIGLDFPKASKAIGLTIGSAYKIYQGITGTDKAGNAMKEFADLDLSKPENQQRALELWAIANEEEPTWGHLGGSMQRRQQAVRARLDLNYLHGGHPQKYNTFTKETGYDTSDGIRTYGYSDPEMLKNEQAFITNYIKTHEPSKITKSGKYIWEVPSGDPYVAHGKSTIVADDRQGTNGRGFDNWNFGVGSISSELLPGMEQVLVGMKIL